MKILKIHRLCILLLTALMLSLLTACSFNGGSDAQAYVSGVNENIQEAVNLTRQLREIQKTVNTRSADDTKNYRSLLERLEETYAHVLELHAPDHYDDLNTDIRQHSEIAMTAVSQLQSLVAASLKTGDDSIYQRESVAIMEKYDESYARLVELDAETQTRFRND